MERNRNVDKLLPMPVSDDIVKGDVISVYDMHTKKIVIYECVREENHAPYRYEFRCLDGVENSREGAWGILPDQYKWKKNELERSEWVEKAKQLGFISEEDEE